MNRDCGYGGKVPAPAFVAFERGLFGQWNAEVSLAFYIRAGKYACHFVTTSESEYKADGGYGGKVPLDILGKFETAMRGILHGTGKLTFFIREGRLERYAITREDLYIPDGKGGDNA